HTLSMTLRTTAGGPPSPSCEGTTPRRAPSAANQASSIGATVLGEPRPIFRRTRSIVGRSCSASSASAAAKTSSCCTPLVLFWFIALLHRSGLPAIRDIYRDLSVCHVIDHTSDMLF